VASLSARIGTLRSAAGELGKLDTAIRTAQETLSGAHNGFNNSKEFGALDAAALLGQILTWVDLNGKDIDYLNTVAQVFEDTDARLGREATDTEIQAALAAAGLTGPRPDMTIDQVKLTGIPTTSGFSNDPVNTASGNFYEVEDDLGFGPAFGWFGFRRTYNSRHRFVGPFGPGWSSIASARLVLSASERFATWLGPDGQAGRIPMADGTLPGTQGHVEHHPEHPAAPLRLVFPLEDLTWHFDADGRPTLLDKGPGDQMRLSWRGEQLLGMRHVRGRGVTLTWDAARTRVVAVEADDGRKVTYAYDEAGQLTGCDGPQGRRTYEWDDKGRITAVVDADGVVEARNNYDIQGRVVQQLTPFGRRIRFWYRPGLVTEVDDTDGGPLNAWYHDERGQLEQVVDGEGGTTTNLWTAGGQVAAMTDRRGGVTRYTYDEHGRQVRTELPGGTWEEQAWDDRHRLVAVTTPAGTTTYGYDGDQRRPSSMRDPEGGTVRTELGDDGLVLAVTDPDGYRLSFTYDDEGRVVTSTDPSGGVRRYEYNAHGQTAAVTSPLGHVVRFGHDAAGRVVTRTDPDGSVWRTEHSPAGRVLAVVDPLGNREETRYGAHGERSEVVDPLGGTTRYDYDTQGNVAAILDPLGHTWRTEHDGCQRPVATVDPLGHTWHRRHDPEGEVSATDAPSGKRQEIPRDEAGRPLALTAAHAGSLLGPTARQDPDALPFQMFLAAGFAGLPDAAEVTVGYDAAGNVATLGRADGTEARSEYDGCGRVAVLVQPSGATTRFGYTPGGRLSLATGPTGSITRYRYDDCGRMAEMIDPTGSRTRVRYDADGNVVELLEATGDRTRHSYDACSRVVSSTTANGGTTTYEYDAAGRQVAVTSPTGGVTRIAHDAAGRTIATTDANGGTTTYEYDGRDNLVAEIDPLGARTTHVYDACGRLTATVDPLGRETTRVYDVDGRLVSITEPDGTVHELLDDSDEPDASDASGEGGDADGPALVRDELGRISEVATPDGQVLLRHEWDVDGNLVGETTITATQGWTYDPAGRLVAHTLELPGQEPATTHFRLDAGGRPVTVTDPALGRVVVERDAAGRATRVVGAGLDERRTWRHGQLSAWARVRSADEAAAALAAEVRYVRDVTGRITRARHGDGTTVDYRYDPAGQLTEVRRDDSTWRFGWDAAGRLATEDTPDGRRAFTYDAAGQLTELDDHDGTTRVAWDLAGRRESEVGPAGTRSYTWDADSGRLSAVLIEPVGVDDPTVHQLDYDILGRLCAVDNTALAWDAATDPVPRLVGVAGQRITGAPGAPVAPALVAPDGMPDWLPAVDDRYDVPGLDPWGRAGRAQGGGPVLIPGSDLAFGHRQELSIDGLVWLRARAYDPTTRSFLSPDPLPPVPGAPWTHNTYHYAANDPVNFCDPLGLQALSDEALAEVRADFKKGWWEKHWKVVAGIGVIALGVVLTVIPVGGPLGVGLMLLGGALIGGGASYSMQMGMTGEVSWKQVFIDAGIGALSAGLSGLAAKGLSSVAMPTLARVSTVAATEAVVNVGAGMTTRAINGQPVLDWTSIGIDAGVGGILGGGVAGGIAWKAARNAPTVPVSTPDTPTIVPTNVDGPRVEIPASGIDDLPTGTSTTGAGEPVNTSTTTTGAGDNPGANTGAGDNPGANTGAGDNTGADTTTTAGDNPADTTTTAGDPNVVNPADNPAAPGQTVDQPRVDTTTTAAGDPNVVNPADSPVGAVDQPRVDTAAQPAGQPRTEAPAQPVDTPARVADPEAFAPIHLGEGPRVNALDQPRVDAPTGTGLDDFEPIHLGDQPVVRGADDVPARTQMEAPPARAVEDPAARLDPELEPAAAAAVSSPSSAPAAAAAGASTPAPAVRAPVPSGAVGPGSSVPSSPGGPTGPGGSGPGGPGGPGAGAPPPRFPPRRPSQWHDIADPGLQGNALLPDGTRVGDHFHGPTSRLPRDARDLTAGFVTVDGQIPPSMRAADPSIAANPGNAVRFSGNGLHAEDVVIQSGDLQRAVQDAAELAAATGNRVPVNLVINRSPCNTRCPTTITNYVTRELPGALVRPPRISQVDWDAALRNVDIELHVPHAYEPPRIADRTTTGDLLQLESSGVRVVVYQPRPGEYRPGNPAAGGKGSGGNDGGSGEALNETLTHLDDYRLTTGSRPPRHWTETGEPPGPEGLPPSGGPDPGPDVPGGPRTTDPTTPQSRADTPAAPQARTGGPADVSPPARPVEPPAARPADPPTGRPTEPPAARPTDPPVGRPTEPPGGRPVEPPAARPADPAQPTGPRPVDQPSGPRTGEEVPGPRAGEPGSPTTPAARAGEPESPGVRGGEADPAAPPGARDVDVPGGTGGGAGPRGAPDAPGRPAPDGHPAPDGQPSSSPEPVDGTAVDGTAQVPPRPDSTPAPLQPVPPPRLNPGFRPVIKPETPAKWWQINRKLKGLKESLFPKSVRMETPPPPGQAPAHLHPTHQIDLLIQQQYVRQVFHPSPVDVGQRVSGLYPHRFAPTPGADQRLADAIEQFGRENPEQWLDFVNPHFNAGNGGMNAYGTNCTDNMRAYADARQGAQPYAASGDRAFFEADLTAWWAGAVPNNTIYAQNLGDLGLFQQRAWSHVALQLRGHPPGTVAIVGVGWEPYMVNGVAQRGAAHVFGAEVAPDGTLRWVDPQPKPPVYRPWPPQYPNRVRFVQSMFRRPDEMVWRTDSPLDQYRAVPSAPIDGPFQSNITPYRFEGGTLAMHDGLPSLTGGQPGPALTEHMGAADSFMEHRLWQNPDLPYHSTFDNGHTADFWVDQAIGSNQARVDQWLQGSTDARLTIDQPFSSVTGRAMVQGQSTSVPATGVKVVLERRPPGSWPAYLIVKAQPSLVAPPPPPTFPPTVAGPAGVS